LFGWLRRKDWRTSPAHLLLLSKFRRGDSPTRYHDVEHWEAALGEKAANVIVRFVRDGMLEPGELRERVDYQFKLPDLKSMLKERGLRVSGRKEELIRRLIDNDAQAMNKATEGIDLYRCTAAGVQLAGNYLEGERIRREVAERQVLSLLAGREFSKAVCVVAQYEAAQVFSRGLGIDWKNYDGRSDVESLRAIFDVTPAILRRIEDSRLSQLRPPAGMMLLWGTGTARQWLPDGFETGIRLDGNTACRMLVFHAHYLRSMKEYREADVRMAKVLGCNDGAICSECRSINGKKYPLDNVPELPYANCTCESGCRCTIVIL
jgi:hypothetical protein